VASKNPAGQNLPPPLFLPPPPPRPRRKEKTISASVDYRPLGPPTFSFPSLPLPPFGRTPREQANGKMIGGTTSHYPPFSFPLHPRRGQDKINAGTMLVKFLPLFFFFFPSPSPPSRRAAPKELVPPPSFSPFPLLLFSPPPWPGPSLFAGEGADGSLRRRSSFSPLPPAEHEVEK